MQRGMGPSNKRSRATKLELAKSHLDPAQAQVGKLEVLLQGGSMQRGMGPSNLNKRSRATERLAGDHGALTDSDGELPDLVESESDHSEREDEAGPGAPQQRRTRPQPPVHVATPSMAPRPRPVRDSKRLQRRLELAKSHLDRAGANVDELAVLSQGIILGISAAPAAKQGLTSKTTVETTAPAPAPARKGQIFVRVNQAAETVAEADGSKKRVGATKTLEASSADLVASVKRQLQGTCAAQRLLFAGRELPDHATLAECGVSLESTLDALPRCVGGGGGQTKLSKTGAGAGARADGGADAAGPAVGAAPTLAARTTVAAVRVDAHNRALTEENAALARENATLKERLAAAAAAATSTASEARPDAKPSDALRKQIAKNPTDFFASANVKQNGFLTLEEWAAVCARVLGHEEPELAREPFGQMDLDKDGTVSREEFVEMRNAIRLFVSGANTQGLLVEMLVGAVTAHLATTTPPHDTSVADKTLDALVSLKETELHEAVAALSRAMREHGEQMRREREKRAKALTQLQLDEGEGKFASLPTAAYGTKDDFHKGLEVRRNGRDT